MSTNVSADMAASNSPPNKRLAAFELKEAAYAMGVRPHLLTTFSEIMYSIQLTPDGKGEQCFTGTMMEKKIFAKPRTFNRHVKELSKDGWISHELRAPPYGFAVRSTWIKATDQGLSVMQAAALRSAKKKNTKQAKNTCASSFQEATTSAPAQISIVTSVNVSSSYEVTKLDKVLTKKGSGDQGEAPASPNQLPAEGLKLPTELVRQVIEESCKSAFVSIPKVKGSSDQRALEEIAAKLRKREWSEADCRCFFEGVADHWHECLALLPEKYQAYSANFEGPTYVALNKGLKLFMKSWLEQQACQE